MTEKDIMLRDRIDELYADNSVVLEFAKQWIVDNPDHWYDFKRYYGFLHVSDEVALDHLIKQNLIFQDETFNTAFIEYCTDIAEYEYEKFKGIE